MAKRICSRPECNNESNCKGLCRKYYKAMRRAEGYKDPQRDKQCPQCGADFKGRHDQVYCSSSCRVTASNKSRPPGRSRNSTADKPKARKRLCAWCKTQFELVPHQVKIYCSSECSEAMGAYLLQEREEREQRPTGCRHCGGERQLHKSYCADCVKALKRQARARSRKVAREQGKGWASLTSHRSRARHYGVAYQSITPADIYQRDGWTCGICSQKVDPALKYPDLMSASLDHITPMVKGGGHVPDNVQCSHFLCNSLKGDRVNAG